MPTLSPSMAAAIVVVTDELGRSVDPAAAATITFEMRGAVSDVVDAHFWSLITDTSTSVTASSGGGVDGFKRDLLTLLNEVNEATGALLWAMSPDVANQAALLDDRGAMSPTGGELAGLPAMVSKTVPAGTLRLLDGAGIAMAADPMTLDASNEAVVEMESSPENNSVSPTETEMTSLFQTNSTALRARIWFAAERARMGAVGRSERHRLDVDERDLIGSAANGR